MATPIIDMLVDTLNKQADHRHFYTIPDLLKLGIFGTAYSARRALKLGILPCVRISTRRTIIPRAALLEYLNRKLSENQRDAPEVES